MSNNVDGLGPDEKRARLAQLLREGDGDWADRLSPAQRRFWVLRQMEPAVPSHVSAAWELNGPLDTGILQAGLRAVVERHELLRCGFVNIEGTPMPVTARSGWVAMTVIDLTALPGTEQDGAIARTSALEGAAQFDAGHAPLVRACCLRRAPDRHVLVLTMHQLIADATSLAIVGCELADAYEALMRGDQPNGLPGGAPPFGQIVAEERAWLTGEPGALAWWRERLHGATVLSLPTDRPRPAVAVQTLQGRTAVRECGVSPPRRARHKGHAFTDTVYAAYLALLARYTGERDLTVGCPVDARPPGAANAVGPFENNLPVRVRIQGDPSFDELVVCARRAREVSLTNGRVPLERILEVTADATDTTRAPLFGVRFDDRPVPACPTGSTVDWAPLDIDFGLSPFDLTLRTEVHGNALRLVAEHSTHLFDGPTIDRLLGHLETLLGAGIEDPTRRLSDLPVLTEPERDQLNRWNCTAAPFPHDRSLHALVEDQVRRTPDATAIIGPDGRLSYRELNRRADVIAARLRAAGIRPERTVAVAALRQARTVTAFLAVLKIGGAYLPVDPDFPRERVAWLLDDARADVMISPQGVAAQLPVDGRMLICPDGDALEDGNPPRAPWPAPEVHPDSLAYVIYTSGSTGRPKGVEVAHRQIVASTWARFGRLPGDIACYLMLAPPSFDASAAGIYWTLCTGGTLILPSDTQVRDPRLLARVIERDDVSHLDAAPSQYAVLLDAQPRAVAGLRCCILAGEALPPALVRRHYRAAPDTALYNEYGPTEATVWATAALCRPSEEAATVPIGQPIANARVHLLDPDLNLVPVGVPGEIYIGGAGVARGYLRRPGATADRFVPDPHTHEPGARMYRTGDLGRRTPSGDVDFVGRTDTQIKVRGFRVELAEIEVALEEHPAVRAAAVAVPDEPNDPPLSAFVVAHGSTRVDEAELTEHLRRLLPAYMVPSRIVAIDEMPQTAHGKLDRAALAHTAQAPTLVPGVAAPRTKTERETAEAFADALGARQIGLDDDFFELGGNSLQMARIGSRLSTAYGLDLPLHALFTVPTVAGVSTQIERFREEGFAGLLAARDPAAMLDAEAALDPAITPAGLPPAPVGGPDGILLTGATGYFGAFLLAELLEQTHADVYCIVRSSDAGAAMERVRRNAADFKVTWDDRFERRVKAVPGDLAKPLLGLGPSGFAELARNVDTIYHNGALVNFAVPYSVLKSANVLGTAEILRLACTERAKRVHYVSTIDVFIGSHMPRPFLEVDLPDRPPRVPFSYPQSKWVSEKLMTQARERGLQVTIFRPSIMMGHTQTGACHEQNYVLVGLRGFLELGILPEYDEIMNAVPVDYASRALVMLSLREDAPGRHFHIWNTEGIPTTDTYRWVRSFGYEFDVVPFDHALEQAIQAGPEHPIYPLVPVMLLYSSGDAGLPMDWETEAAIDNATECANSLDALAGKGITCAPMSEGWMHDCLAFLIGRGLLKSPAEIRARLRSRQAAPPSRA